MTTVADPAAIRTRAEFAAALTALRESAGFTVRDLARAVDRPAGTLGDYLSGRHVPGPAQQGLVVAVLAACGVTDDDEVAAWLAALRRVRASSDRRTARTATPYRGLASFEPEDAALFFGRGEQTADILRRVAALRAERGPSHGVLVVIGPSGSGKSSLLRAGVVAAVRGGALDTDEQWTCAVATPAGDPAAALDAALATRGPGPHLVVLDQFEELFTLTRDEDARRAFLASLPALDPEVVVVLGMRADFFSSAAREPVLLAALRHAQVVVGPLAADEVREAVHGPAARVGASVEDGLVEVVLADLAPRDAAAGAHDAGALPLLSHALLAAWDRSNGRRLTLADYRATGGLGAAVQRTAEEVYAALDADGQDAAHDLFVRLVNVEDDVALTRRRISRDEVGLDAEDASALREVVDRFVERRLLTVSSTTVEVSHEALLTAWPRLRGWLDADRAGHAVHRRITTAANAWQDGGRDPSNLLAGTALAVAAEWAAAPAHRRRMNAVEQEYVAAGLARRDETARAERRRTRRLLQLVAALAVLAVATTVVSVLAVRAKHSSDRARAAATSARDDALSRQVAFQSRQLAGADPALAEQLALVSYRIAHSDVSEAALVDDSTAPVVSRALGVLGPTALGVAPRRGLVAVGHSDGTVQLFALRPQRAPARLALLPSGGAGQEVFALAFGPDGTTLAAGGQTKDITLWDVHDTAHPRRLATVDPAFTGDIQSVAVTPDGRTLLAASTGPSPVERWDLTDPAHPRALPAPPGVRAGALVHGLAVGTDGSVAAALGGSGNGAEDGAALVWPAGPTQWTAAPHRLPTGTPIAQSVTFLPGGSGLVVGANRGTVEQWSLAGTPRLVHTTTVSTNALTNAVAVRPDGGEVAVGVSDGTVHTYALPDWAPLATSGSPGPVTGVSFTADGAGLLSTGADGTLRQRVASAAVVAVGGTAFSLGFSSSGVLLAGDNGTPGEVRLWDVHDPSAPRALSPPLTTPPGSAPADGTGAIRLDGSLAAAGTAAGQVQLWDTHDPAHAARVAPPFTATLNDQLVESVAFSPDGRTLAVAADDGDVALWDVGTPSAPRLLGRLAGAGLLVSTAYSPDGRLVAAASTDDSIYVWDVHPGGGLRRVARLTGFTSYVYSVAFSPDSMLLAASGADHTARVWDLSRPGAARPARAPLIGPNGYAQAVTFSPDGRDLAVGSDDHTVRVYDLSSPRNVPSQTLSAFPGGVWSLAYDATGRTLAVGGRAGAVMLFSTDYAAYAARVCAQAGDPITRAEWALYVPGAPYDPPCVSRP